MNRVGANIFASLLHWRFKKVPFQKLNLIKIKRPHFECSLKFFILQSLDYVQSCTQNLEGQSIQGQ